MYTVHQFPTQLLADAEDDADADDALVRAHPRPHFVFCFSFL